MTEDENSWVFDSLVCFLKGPIWDAPIQNFIEEKSLIFEPNNVENEEDYHKIFDEYKNLVDFMLGNFMEDIGITPVQFEYACFKSRQRQHSLRFNQSTFEQIWAANNYDMFKRMMTQRNVELQLQALELIEKKYGILPQSFIPSKKVPQNDHQELQTKDHKLDPTNDIEKIILKEVAKKFVEEENLELPEVKSLLEEKQHLQNERDKISSEMITSEVDTTSFQERTQETSFNAAETRKVEYKNPTEKGQDTSESPSSEMMETKVTKKVEIDLKPETPKTENQLASGPKNENFQIQSSGIKQVDEIELKKRQEYLRKQRDKLVALKKEERRKQFGKTENENMIKKTRPKSAKAAQVVLTGEQSVLPSPDLQFRKALAERLKLEVVEKNKI